MIHDVGLNLNLIFSWIPLVNLSGMSYELNDLTAHRPLWRYLNNHTIGQQATGW